MNGHFLASCLRNIRVKNYSNLVILLKVTIENVRDFFGHSVSLLSRLRSFLCETSCT